MIERLYAHNFRCLENFTLDLSGRPSVLMIGRNGSGKSTVLDCFRIFQQIARGSWRVRDLISAGDFARHRMDLPMRFGIEVVLESGRFGYEIAFEWSTEHRQPRVFEERLQRNGVDVLIRKRTEIQQSENASFVFDWQLVALPMVGSWSGWPGVRDLKQYLVEMMLLAPIPSQMSGFSEEPSTALEENAANFAACLSGLLSQKPAAYLKFEAQLRAVMPDFVAIENRDRGERGTQLVVRFERPNARESLTVEFNALSAGEKCFFLAAYIITINQTGTPVFCAWDEPENHLSLAEVGHFIVSLRKLTNDQGQFIATSHHPETIRKFSGETTFVLKRNSHLEPTLVRPLSEIKYHGDLVHALVRDEVIGLE